MSKYCRICRNTTCSNHGKDIILYGDTWECDYISVPTNADRIRAMSDEELAKFLCEFRSCDSDGHPCSGCKAERYCYTGHTRMKDWLQQPAEEEDT